MTEKLDLVALKEAGVILEGEFTEEALATLEEGLDLPKGNESFLNLKPLYDSRKEDNGKYRFDMKVEAIVNLRAHMDINETRLELEPDFSSVSEYLNVPVQTLRQWWKNRESIVATASVLVDQLTQASTLKNLIIMQKAQESLATRDFDKVSVKDLVILLKTLTVMNRISLDGSLNKKTVDHKHTVAFVKPGSDG